MATDPRAHSLWLDQLTADDPTALRARDPLDGDDRADVVVVGAGLTGLWTAYYLLEADPSLDVLVVEADVAGAGASGHGSGWCSADLSVDGDELVRRHGADGARAMRAALRDAVVEVGGAAAAEQVDCGFAYGGSVQLARTPDDLEHVARRVRDAAALDDDVHLLGPEEVAAHVRAAGVLGGAYSPDCARLQPARLARGLLDVVLGRGARVVEQTRALRVSPRAVVTDRGTVRTTWTVRGTGAWDGGTAVHGVAVATAPLTAERWADVGLDRAQTFATPGPRGVRGERTADDRLVLVGTAGLRGRDATTGPRAVDAERAADGLRGTLHALFPDLADVPLTHRWTGPVAVPADHHPSVGLDDDGIGWAGGYGFDGTAAANLAGRTLADLVTGADSPLVRLPWVGHRSPAHAAAPWRRLTDVASRLSGARAPRAPGSVPMPPR
ncbi:NAD(P)/FAD-dependent oxidoreductase [Cellulomonas biazotea]|uniref:NAD(P)/FAD-dependent oxidoreductase n=2 Tax=Cellulomonas biazotea TaxID=1709 RepID=UPI0035F0BB39